MSVENTAFEDDSLSMPSTMPEITNVGTDDDSISSMPPAMRGITHTGTEKDVLLSNSTFDESSSQFFALVKDKWSQHELIFKKQNKIISDLRKEMKVLKASVKGNGIARHVTELQHTVNNLREEVQRSHDELEENRSYCFTLEEAVSELTAKLQTYEGK